MDRASAIHWITETCPNHAAELIATLRPTIRIATAPVVPDGIPYGGSRFGGEPDVPDGFEWPTWTPTLQARKSMSIFFGPKEGPRPLQFLAQFRLSDLPVLDAPEAESLPRRGHLLFFYDICSGWGFDPEDAGSARVVYWPDEDQPLMRMSSPLGEQDATYEPCAIIPDPTWIVKPSEAFLSKNQDRKGRPLPVMQALMERIMFADENWDEGSHRVLGWPDAVQGDDMELQCQLAASGVYCGDATYGRDPRFKQLEPGASDWRLLFQIDTDNSGPQWMWGDSGRIYYWIRRQDLAARDFSKCWLVLQCC